MSYVLHYAPDNASLIVRLILEEMGLPYDTCLVDRRADAQRSAAYLAMNPAGLIPVLETPYGPISETAAIALWLSDQHGRMAPRMDATGRPAFLKWLFFVSNTLHARLRLYFYPQVYIGAQADHIAALHVGTKAGLARDYRLLEAQLAAGHAWFGGAEVSVLDYYVATTMRWAWIYGDADTSWFDRDAYPNLMTLARQLENRPAAKTAAQAEGLGPAPFSDPRPCQPPEGSAL